MPKRSNARRTPRSAVGALAWGMACTLALTVLGPGAAIAADSEDAAVASEIAATASSTEPAPLPDDGTLAEVDPLSVAPVAPAEPEPVVVPDPAPAPAPQPGPEPEPAPDPQPAPAVEPEPLVQPAQPAPEGAQPEPAERPVAEPLTTDARVELAEAAVVAPLAAGEPEPIVQPYLHWQVSPAAAGSTFELQHRSRTGTVLAGETWWAEWSAWSASAVVTDCTASCTPVGDLDADVGDLQVTDTGSHQVAVNTPTVEHEYRVRPATPPTGSFWTDTSWRTASFSAGVANLGTFTTTANAALTCTAGSFYSLSSAGVITLVTPSGTPTTQVFGAVPNLGNTEANALGIGPGGTTMYVIERPSASSSGIGAFHYYSVEQGWQRIPLSSSLDPARYTAGAVNLADGSYYFAAFSNGQSQSVAIYRFTPTQGITRLGQFSTIESTQQATGDLAFDAAGNLYVVVTSQGSSRVYSIAASTLAAANNTTLQLASNTGVFTGLSDIVGAAFNADGRLYLGNSTTVRIYNPATGAFETGNAATGLSSTDLASCQTPSTMTVVKDVVGRVAAADQFTISVTNAGGTTLDSAATVGTGTGIQATAGPILALVGSTYTFTEAFSNNNASSYATSFTCVDQNGTVLAVDTATTPGSGRVTIPSAGSSVSCTIRNSPLSGSVSIRKVVQDADGTTSTAVAGWSVSTSATATVPTVSVTGATVQQTAADGAASWGLVFGSAAARATVSVSETQQAGYALHEGACIVRPIASAPFVQSFTTAAGTSLQNIAPGTRIECTFVNRQQPTELTLVNQVDFGSADASEWSLAATPTGGSSIAFVDGVMQEVTPGTYLLAATDGPLTYLPDAWSCVDQAANPVTVTGDSVTIAIGTRVTCTITHATAVLTLLKHVDGSAATTISASDFTLTATPAAEPVLALDVETATGSETVGALNTFEVRPAHGYVLTESSALAYLGLTLQYYDGGLPEDGVLDPDGWVDVTDAAAAIELDKREHAVYRFVNSPVPALALPLTGGLGADAYLFGGLGLLVLAAAVLLVRSRTRSSRLGGRLT